MHRPQRRVMTQVVLALALVVLVLTLTRGVSNAAAFERHEAILVLAGGVDKRGAPHCTVAARLRAAANASGAHGGSVPIVLNGGGTTWKPRHVDRNGFSIPEAALMAEQIGRESGILPAMLYPESFSDDTVGNAFFARTMHTDLRPEWRNLLVITSQFQIARTQAIYAWVFGLTPRPAGREYRLRFQAVPDDCLDPKVLALRQAKEAESLRKLEGGPLMHMQTLAEAHEFIWHRHGGYSVRGVLSKQPLDSKLADTY